MEDNKISERLEESYERSNNLLNVVNSYSNENECLRDEINSLKIEISNLSYKLHNTQVLLDRYTNGNNS